MTIDDKLIILMFKMNGYTPTAVYFVETEEVALIGDGRMDFRRLAEQMGLEEEE